MPKKWSVVTAAFIITLMVLFLTACGDDADKTQPIGEPSDYFPIDTGREWTYEIKIGEAEPIFYNETTWPQGSMSMSYSSVGRFLPLLEDEIPEIFLLTIKVNGPAEKQGLLRYPVGVELTIERDELGIFKDHEEVFWTVTESWPFTAHQVVTYSPYTLGAPINSWGGWGQDNGYSMSLLFFGSEPGASIRRAGSPDTLYFEGIVECRTTTCLHFQRTVTLSDDEEESELSLGKDFTEDTWFAKGVGLVRLEQKVEGITSMTWTLK